ncbi:MAG: DUF294 nucleotidyltransferase-like domain-containing protein [Planctomycetaceae bacterium]
MDSALHPSLMAKGDSYELRVAVGTSEISPHEMADELRDLTESVTCRSRELDLVYHQEVAEAIRQSGPLEAYRHLIEVNNQRIRTAELGNGREITSQRTAIHTGLAAHWVDAQARRFGYERPFALVALGGTGRGEMTPCSDTDFALLFEEETKDNAFLTTLLAQTIYGTYFARTYGFAIWPQPYNLEHAPALEGMQLNAFLDMQAVYDPHEFASTFRDRIRATFDPFEHFLHVSHSWRDAGRTDVEGRGERLDRFNIKSEGLRAFLAGVWTLGGPQFRHSLDVYNGLDDTRDLEAYYFLLRIRAFIHLRRGTQSQAKVDGSHAEDVLGFEDFESFGELLGLTIEERERFEFANQVRARLLAARRRVERFARGVVGRELQHGHKTYSGSSIIHGVGGLRHDATEPDATHQDKSMAALSLVLASQKYGVGIDPAELEEAFRNAGDWLLRVPQLSGLFYESRGSLAGSLAFLSQIDGAMERLFPGYTRFESSLDERVLEERTASRGVWVREKLQALDRCLRIGWKLLAQGKARWDPIKVALSDMVVVEAALLDTDHLAAVKLALLTKRLPMTVEDVACQADESLELHERFASGFSGIGLKEYFAVYVREAGFTETTVRVAEFLVANRRVLKQFSRHGRNDEWVVSELVGLCGDVQSLRALCVFTCIDRQAGIPIPDSDQMDSPPGAQDQKRRQWWSHENNAVRWFNTRELYIKALSRFMPEITPNASRTLSAAGYGAHECEILEDFGHDYFDGLYVRHTNHFASHLLRLVRNEETAPKVDLVRDGDASLLGIAARDFRGLAACIAGALYHHRVNLSQAHLFSATNCNLALDFFHLAADQSLPRDLTAIVRDAVQRQLHIAETDAASLPALCGTFQLDGTAKGGYCLRHETKSDASGLLYALTWKVFHLLGASIHGLSALTSRGSTFITVHLTLPHDRPLQEARNIVQREFQA